MEQTSPSTQHFGQDRRTGSTMGSPYLSCIQDRIQVVQVRGEHMKELNQDMGSSSTRQMNKGQPGCLNVLDCRPNVLDTKQDSPISHTPHGTWYIQTRAQPEVHNIVKFVLHTHILCSISVMYNLMWDSSLRYSSCAVCTSFSILSLRSAICSVLVHQA